MNSVDAQKRDKKKDTKEVRLLAPYNQERVMDLALTHLFCIVHKSIKE